MSVSTREGSSSTSSTRGFTKPSRALLRRAARPRRPCRRRRAPRSARRPPWARTTWRTRLSPSPAPGMSLRSSRVTAVEGLEHTLRARRGGCPGRGPRRAARPGLRLPRAARTATHFPAAANFVAFATRFVITRRSAAASPRTAGRLGGHVLLDRDAALLEDQPEVAERLVDELADGHRLRPVRAARRGDAGEVERLRDERREARALALDELPVPLDGRRLGDDPVGEVLAGRPDRRERRVHLVRDAGHELDLLPREGLRALRGDGEHRAGGAEEREHAEAEGDVASAHARDGLVERAAAVPDDQQPQRRAVGTLRLDAGTGTDRRRNGVGPRLARALRAARRARIDWLAAGHLALAGPPPRRSAVARAAFTEPAPLRAATAVEARERPARVAAAEVRRGHRGIARVQHRAVRPPRDRHDQLALRERPEVRLGERREEVRADLVDVQEDHHVPGGREAAPTREWRLGCRGRGRAVRRREDRKAKARRLVEHPRPERLAGGVDAQQPLAHRIERREPVHGVEAGGAVVASLERDARGRARHEQETAHDRVRVATADLGQPRGELGARVAQVAGLRPEREEGLAQLAVEGPLEARRRALELRLLPLGVGPSEVAQPPVLEHREHDEQHGEGAERHPERVRPGPPHVRECSSGARDGRGHARSSRPLLHALQRRFAYVRTLPPLGRISTLESKLKTTGRGRVRCG